MSSENVGLVGTGVPAAILHGRRHGVLIEAAETGQVEAETARTKRGARRLYLDVLDWLPITPARARLSPGDEVLVSRVERRRVVEERRLRIPDESPPDTGVREPRREPPSAGSAAVSAPLPDDE